MGEPQENHDGENKTDITMMPKTTDLCHPFWPNTRKMKMTIINQALATLTVIGIEIICLQEISITDQTSYPHRETRRKSN